MIIMIGQDKRSLKEEQRQVLKERILSAMVHKGGVIEVLDWRCLFETLGIPIGFNQRRQCRRALNSLIYGHHLMYKIYVWRDEEKWERYILSSQ